MKKDGAPLRVVAANAHPAFEGAGLWLEFADPREMIVIDSLETFSEKWTRLRRAVGKGYYIAGWVGYEAAPFFDPAFAVHSPAPGAPLAWFGVFEEPNPLAVFPGSTGWVSLPDWRPALTGPGHAAVIERIREWIASGDAYQINFTFPFEARFEGDPGALMAALGCFDQRKAHAALVETPERAVVSASPELFFLQDGDAVTTRPMKGTAPRGRWPEEDAIRAAQLQSCPKNRAENVMIADLLRNDLGRIAQTGSVEADPLFELERYETVWQMTSTVRARTPGDPFDTLAALFPCGSITGAPKIRATEIIRELEAGPRGAYTGAIGWIGPGRRAWFNVAIRTIEIAEGAARYGVGGGITWSSRADDEYRECLHKAAILLRPRPDFELLETMRWDPPAGDGDPMDGFFLWPRHAARLAASAAYFGFDFDMSRVRRALDDWLGRTAPAEARRVRLLHSRRGGFHVECSELKGVTHPDLNKSFKSLLPPVKLVLTPESVDETDVFLYHKTTHREVYERAREAAPDADDVLLFNQKGELTESTIANLVIETVEGRRLTPRRRCGLLAGTLRAELLERGLIEEATLTREDAWAARKLWLVNSVRGIYPAALG